MKRTLTGFLLLTAALAIPLSSMAEDLLRICYARYPGCTLYIYDYRDGAYDFSSLWCGDEFIYEQSGFGGRVGSGSECVYFV